MKRKFFRMLVVSFGAAVLAAAATAGEPDHLVVNIPYDFVVNGKTLPAGKYNVKRNSDSDLHLLSISSFENHAYIVTMTTDVNDVRESQPHVTLIRNGDQSVLTKIQTAEHVFTIPATRATKQALSGAQDPYLTGTTEPGKQ